MIDVVTPLGPNDKIQGQLPYTRENVIGIRDHYVVTRFSGCEHGEEECRWKMANFTPESIFPFSWQDIYDAGAFRQPGRVGWYLQQLIKLYAWKVIPGLSDPYLVLDADTHLLRPLNFHEEGVLLFTKAYEWHKPYFRHMERLHPFLERMQNASGVAHHMPMSHEVLASLFNLVEDHHGCPFWEAFMKCVDPQERGGSGASEYEIVFNYTQKFFPDMFRLRNLNWRNVKRIPDEEDLDFISKHWYL